MRTVIAIGVALLVVSAAPADEGSKAVEVAKATTPAPAAEEWRSIMIYLKPSEGIVTQPYPLRDEPYIVTLDEVALYRKGQRACDTVIEVCRPRADGTFLTPGTPEERRRHCGPLEAAPRATCTAPPRGSF